MNKVHTCAILFLSLCVCSCINNDIPYPRVEAFFTGFTVENQCDANGNAGGSAIIDRAGRTVDLYVDDTSPLSAVRVTGMTISEDATMSISNPEQCANAGSFPSKGFSSLEDLSSQSNTVVDFTTPLKVRLTTYQDYDWTVRVTQVVKREILLDGQIGDPVIDVRNRTVIAYVSAKLDLKNLKVQKFSLGGPRGSVSPDPAAEGVYDFSDSRRFTVKYAFDANPEQWTVFVYPSTAEVGAESKVFPMSTRAHISGSMQSGQSIKVEYRKKSDSEWSVLDQECIEEAGTRFTAVIYNLSPETDYCYRISSAGSSGIEKEFTTAPAPALTDGSFDNWHQVGKKWNPWAEGGTSFWDTGNQGASTVGDSNSVPTDDTCNGSGKAAFLESKYIVIKFAAGNIFTGEYVETDGTNGVVDFGRPFNGFPTALKVNYKYKSSIINRSSDADYEYLKGRPDSCQIFIALADWDKPFRVRTRPSARSVFSPSDPGVIAYGQITVGDDVPQWKEQIIPLEYYHLGRTPKYIVVVASASKYGDYFTGGEGTSMWVDNFELVYD